VSLIEVEDLEHCYSPGSPHSTKALERISFTVEEGEYVALVGPNGSGKSTLAFHLNGLLQPTAGRVLIDGNDTKCPSDLPAIRRTVAMVFQKPEEQIVALTVEEDTAFGPENLALGREEIRRRVSRSLSTVGLAGYELRSPHKLSAGQKQRLAIAGALALEPRAIVFDEATSMLDPRGRRETLALMRELNRRGTTIVHITHRMEEVVEAERVVVLDSGRIQFDGASEELFGSRSQVLGGLGRPAALETAFALSRRCGIDLGTPTDYPTLSEAILAALPDRSATRGNAGRDGRREGASPRGELRAVLHSTPLIEVSGLSHSYARSAPEGRSGRMRRRRAHQGDTPRSLFTGTADVPSLHEVSLSIGRGECVAVIGPTGSGKSTLLQHLNALFLPQEGEVRVDGVHVGRSEAELPTIRRKVGLVFQRPEEQIFAQYVGDEIAYGPRLAGLGGKELTERVRWAMDQAGLGFEELKDRLTFALSGGEQRKVGLAGILALRPTALLLDEPTVGLDATSRRRTVELIARLLDEGTTVVISTHDMDVAARLADRIVVLSKGSLVMEGTSEEVFGRADALRSLGLDVPGPVELLLRLRRRGIGFSLDYPLRFDGIVDALAKLLGERVDVGTKGEV